MLFALYSDCFNASSIIKAWLLLSFLVSKIRFGRNLLFSFDFESPSITLFASSCKWHYLANDLFPLFSPNFIKLFFSKKYLKQMFSCVYFLLNFRCYIWLWVLHHDNTIYEIDSQHFVFAVLAMVFRLLLFHMEVCVVFCLLGIFVAECEFQIKTFNATENSWTNLSCENDSNCWNCWIENKSFHFGHYFW